MTQIKGSNMKLKIVILAFCLFFVGSAAFSATNYYIPQVVVGPFGMNDTNFSYRTSFIFFNNTSASSDVTLNLFNSDHSEMTVTMTGLGMTPVVGSSFTFTLPVGSAKILQASSDSLAAGPADVIATSDSGVGVVGRYTIYNDDAGGTFVTEVGVKAIEGSTLRNDFVIPVQETDSGAVLTGIALYNPYPWETTMDLSLKNQFGAAVGSYVVTLGSGQHTAFYVDQDFPDIGGTNFYGMLKIQSDGPIAAMTLRQNAPSFITYTSCPVVPTTSTQRNFTLAQFADGVLGGVKYKTTLMLQNFRRSTVTINFAATGGGGGDAIPLRWISSTGDAFTNTIDLGAGETRFMTSDGGANAQGGIVITSSAPIGAAALFLLTDMDDNFMTEAGVQDSPVLNRLTMPVHSRMTSDGSTLYGTALALYNPSASPVTLRPTYLDESGLMLTAGTVTLAPGAQQASFFDQFFPGMGTVVGSLAFQAMTATSGVSAMVLGANIDPFNMTSFSSVSGTAGVSFAFNTGTPRYTVVDLTATGTTVNKIIPYAPTLAVAVSGLTAPSSYTPLYLHAISQNDGHLYKRRIDPTAAGAVPLYVPAGYYTLRYMGWQPGNAGQFTGGWIDYTTDPISFNGSATTTSLVVPNVPQRAISGSIANYDALKSALGVTSTVNLSFYGTALTNSHIQLVVYCTTSTTAGSADGASFVQYFPEGVYTAAIAQVGPIYPTTGYSGTQPTQMLGLQNLLTAGASFTVDSNNAPVTNMSFNGVSTLYGSSSTIPNSLPAGGGAGGPFAITAVDTSLPDLGYINPFTLGASFLNVYPGFFYYPRNTTWTQNTFGGQYSAIVGTGSSYKLSSQYNLYTTLLSSAGTMTTAGIVTYAPPAGASVGIGGDTNFEFNIPTLPDLIMVGGQVTGAFGIGGTVMARCNEVYDMDGNIIPGLSYFAFVGYGSNGYYQMQLLPGLNYQLYFETNPMLIVQ